MDKKNPQERTTNSSNKALRGKPHLDIDRIISDSAPEESFIEVNENSGK